MRKVEWSLSRKILRDEVWDGVCLVMDDIVIFNLNHPDRERIKLIYNEAWRRIRTDSENENFFIVSSIRNKIDSDL